MNVCVNIDGIKHVKMAKIFSSLVILILSLSTHAEVLVQTVYFRTNEIQPVEESKKALSDLALKLTNPRVQIIELNVYTSLNMEPHAVNKTCSERADFLIQELNLFNENFAINKYGTKRINLNFVPEHWERADIYYYESEPNYLSNDPTILTQRESDIVESSNTIELDNDSYSNAIEVKKSNSQSFVLDIKFFGGTADMKPNSERFLNQLIDTLVTNSTLQAHIRGHVCCGNKKSISRKRARAVYKYLVKSGIDSKRLSYKGYSNSEPLVYPEKSDRDRSMNRRVDVQFHINLDTDAGFTDQADKR